MSTLHEIQTAITELSSDDRRALLSWLLAADRAAWDEQNRLPGAVPAPRRPVQCALSRRGAANPSHPAAHRMQSLRADRAAVRAHHTPASDKRIEVGPRGHRRHPETRRQPGDGDASFTVDDLQNRPPSFFRDKPWAGAVFWFAIVHK